MNSKFIMISVVVVILISIAVYYYWYRNGIISGATEGFWDIPSRAWKVERVFENRNEAGGPDFFQTPHFQGILEPRFSNADYGPYLRTQLPGYSTSGVPADPLGGDVGGSFSAAKSGCVSGACGFKQVDGGETKEGFPTNNSLRQSYATDFPTYMSNNESNLECVKMDPHNPSSYTNGNYSQVMLAGMAPDLVSDSAVNAEPTASYLTLDGEMKQPIVYDRYMYANRNSRLRAMGDPIRGDLPIVPASGNWFTPSVHPNIDLQAGAINVLSGVGNETNQQLAQLIYASSGGADTAIGGVSMNGFNMSNQMPGFTGAGRGDVIITSFP